MHNHASSDEHGETIHIEGGYLGITPPQGELPPKGQRSWVDRPDQLQLAVEQLKQAPVVAIDAEFTQTRSHAQQDTTGPRLALLQLAITGQCFVIDALRLPDLIPLNAVVADPARPVLLHGAGVDLRVMAERGLTVAFYYDLEATSRSLFGSRESSLAAMLQRALNVHLDKSLQRTDWTRRPLPPAMVAYAARDAEMTLALYAWLRDHFAWALRLHASDNLQEPVAAWIEPLLHGSLPMPAEILVAEAIKQGSIRDQEQVYADCLAALQILTHPQRKSRLLRLITDLALVQLVPEIKPLLQASTSDERAAAVRALSRLDTEQSRALIEPLLHDPVYDVRKAALNALTLSTQKEPRNPWAAPTRRSDGSRSWSVGETAPAQTDDNTPREDDDWRKRLRSLMNDE